MAKVSNDNIAHHIQYYAILYSTASHDIISYSDALCIRCNHMVGEWLPQMANLLMSLTEQLAWARSIGGFKKEKERERKRTKEKERERKESR